MSWDDLRLIGERHTVIGMVTTSMEAGGGGIEVLLHGIGHPRRVCDLLLGEPLIEGFTPTEGISFLCFAINGCSPRPLPS